MVGVRVVPTVLRRNAGRARLHDSVGRPREADRCVEPKGLLVDAGML